MNPMEFQNETEAAEAEAWTGVGCAATAGSVPTATELLERAHDMLARANIMLDGWQQAVDWHHDYERFKTQNALAAAHGSELPTEEGEWQRGSVRVTVSRIGAGRCRHSYLLAVFPLGNRWSVTQLPPRLRGGWMQVQNEKALP